MKRLLFLVLVLAALVPASQAQEVLNITTYYPSPNGVYRTLRLFPVNTGMPTCNATNEGVMYLDSSGTDHYIRACHYNSATSAYDWVALSVKNDCTTITCANSNNCNCPAGYYLTGGGCGQGGASVALYESYQSGDTQWNCRGAGTVTTTVRCCK